MVKAVGAPEQSDLGVILFAYVRMIPYGYRWFEPTSYTTERSDWV